MRLFLVLITILIGIIPYFTGIKIEQQFIEKTNSLNESANLKLLQNNYRRGWFNSNAIYLVKINEQLFSFEHNINHGWMPVLKISIYTIVKSSNQILLDIFTKVKLNGDNVSIVNVSNLEVANYKWQGLQGNIYANRQFTNVEAEFNSSQLNYNQLKVQNAALQLNINNGIANGNLEIASILGQGLDLEDIKFFGKGQIKNNNLILTVQNIIKKVQDYGSSSSNIELSNIYLPSLLKSILTYSENITFNWLIQGMELLEYLPKLVITNFKLNTPEGLVHGKLHIQLKPLKNPLLVIFNPNSMLNILDLQLSASVPKLLSIITSNQLSNSWIQQGFLIEDDLNYYKSDVTLNDGLLRINKQQLPLTVLIP